VISNAKSRNGNIYPYFVCAGRHRKATPCTRSAVLLDDAERLVIDYYQHNIQIPGHIREQLRGMLATEFDHLLASSEAELTELTGRRDQLEAEQTKLLHAYYADAIALLDPVMHDRARTWADDPAAYAGSLSTREPISLVPGLNFDDLVRPEGIEPSACGLKDRCSLAPRREPLTTELRARAMDVCATRRCYEHNILSVHAPHARSACRAPAPQGVSTILSASRRSYTA
jgi:hypothetical protein